MGSEKVGNYVVVGWGVTALAVLWALYFTHERDLYKLFALLGLSSGLVGVVMVGMRFPTELPWKRPIGLAFLVLAFFLHGFANFMPDLFPDTLDAGYVSPARHESMSPRPDDEDDADSDQDPGPQFPDV